MNPIVLATLLPADRAHAGTVAQVQRSPTRPHAALRVRMRQHAGNVLVGQAVKTVTAHAALGDGGRQRECLRYLRLRTVECGVEACDLRQFRPALGEQANRHQIVRLVQRRQRHVFLELREHLGRDERRLGEIEAAVYDAMANGDQAVVVRAVRAGIQSGSRSRLRDPERRAAHPTCAHRCAAPAASLAMKRGAV